MNCRELDAACGLGQPGDLAGALGGTGRKQFIDIFQIEARFLAKLADHGGDAEFLVIIPQIIDHLRADVRLPYSSVFGGLPAVGGFQDTVQVPLD